MNGTGSAMSTDVALRDTAALAVQPGQTSFDELQLAALRQIGMEDASDGERSLLLHMSQRTGLDPFSGQIRAIPRREKVKGQDGRDHWRTKYTIQTGIDGLRVMRSRAERSAGARGVLSRPVYYDAEGSEHKVWFQRTPPVAVEMTYTVRERDSLGETPYTSILRFTEYAQTRKDDQGNVVLSGQWAVKGVHMLEKCTEADLYRKAFPQDFSGVELDDAMPAPGPDAPPEQSRRQRVTAAQARERAPQVKAEVVRSEPAPGAGPGPSPDAPAPRGQVGRIRAAFKRLYPGDETDTERTQRLAETTALAGREDLIGSTNDLTADEAATVIRALDRCPDADALKALLASGDRGE